VLFVTGYQVAEGFSSIQDGVDKCFSQEAKLMIGISNRSFIHPQNFMKIQ